MARHRAHGRDRRWPPRPALLAGGAVITVALIVVAYLLATKPQPGPTAASLLTRSRACSAGPGGHCGSPSAGPAPTSAAPPASTSATPQAQPAGSLSSPPRPSPPSSATASADPPAPGGAAAASVLAVINEARAQAGLPAYTILSGLETSSARHNQLMAGGCGLSHQCPGEPSGGDRETAAGVQWTAWGENIGEGGPFIADTAADITQMAVTLTNDMLAEQPPDDGHRLNILSSAFTSVGIAIYRDGNGVVWMTQDFAN